MNALSPIYATKPSDKVSSRYHFISTNDVIQTFEQQGFSITSVQYPKARKDSRVGFNSHLIRMRRNDVDTYATEVPEVLIINSHDCTKAFRLSLGFFRFVCTNGLIVGDMLADTGRITHKGQVAVEVLNFVSEYSKNVTKKIEHITQMKETYLSADEIEEFRLKAAELIHPNIKYTEQLLHINRAEDKSPNVWTTFNVIQENAMKGNYQIVGATNNTRKARPIKNLTRNVELNTKLWSLAEEYIDV